MRRTGAGRVWAFALMALMVTAQAVMAQQALVPDRRVSLMPDTDLPGGDLTPIFETSLEACIQACLADTACVAMTYNQRSRACFPKGALGIPQDFIGATSAQVLDNAVARQQATRRAAAAEWLADADLQAALRQVRSFGATFTALASDDPVGDAARAAGAGDLTAASGYLAMEVGRSDAADAWFRLARQVLPDPQRYDSDAVDTAASLALNGYLRADDDALAAQALQVLAAAWEQLGRGRDGLKALRLAATLSPAPGIADALAASEARNGFRVIEQTVQSESLSPSFCAAFSELLSERLDYASFVRLPDSGLTVEARGDQLCVGGLTHGQDIAITLRRGLPAADGETLARDVAISGYIRDRSPAVRFPGRAYVLPSGGDRGLAMTTVNLDRVDLRLMRMSDRNLIGALQDDLFARPLDAWSAQRFNTDRATEVWRGSATVAGQGGLNVDVTTRLAIPEEAGPLAPGIYVLQATVPGQDVEETGVAAQWFVISDLGISTLMGVDGLTVVVRGLADAGSKQGAEVTLLSRANAVLGTALADDDGVVRFDAGMTRGPGSQAPAAVVVRGAAEDMAFLSLTDPEFDLSDRGVAGLPPSPPIDVFLTLDRGAYRAGEVINATVLARDGQVQALDGLPVTAILYRPDGVEAARQMPEAAGDGGYVLAFPLAASAPRGTWHVDIRVDADGPALASARALLEDFLPERIDFEPALAEGPLVAGQTVPVSLDARWLFGAPAADLPVEGSVTLAAARRLPGFDGVQFGRQDAEETPQTTYLPAGQTDAQGHFATDIALPDGTGAAQTATIALQVREGAGRPVERVATRLVLPPAPLIGIRPLFAGDAVSSGDEARFAVVAVGSDLGARPMPVRWVLNRVETDYQWYAIDGRWNWEPVTRRRQVAAGEALAGSGEIAVPVDWGQYELVVEGTGAAGASVLFQAGWGAAQAGTDTPDRLRVALDKAAYRSGETAQVHVTAQRDAVAIVSVLSNRVSALKIVPLTAGENTIPLAVTDDWGAGSYVTVSALRPMDDLAGDRGGVRALGLAYAPVDPGARALQVLMDVPSEIAPRGSLPVRLRVSGQAAGDVVHATVAVVDQGILNLTGFKVPDPMEHYFGQRRLGVGLRDLYGRLILPTDAPDGVLRSGGDAGGAMGTQAPPPTEALMSWFSGPVTLGADGTATLDVPVPDFIGSVQVMAVAWSAGAVGQATAVATIRDPVVMVVTAPRFLSPGDTGQVSLALTHVTGPVGDVGLSVADAGDVGLNPGALPATVEVAESGSTTVSLPVRAGGDAGTGLLRFSLTTPAGDVVTKEIAIPVSLAEPDVTRTARLTLAPGETAPIDPALMAGLGTGALLTATAGPFAALDVAGALGRLARYPYGCTEQLASVAMPLLFVPELSAQVGGLGDQDTAKAVQDAITAILTRQTAEGAFGLWGPGAGDFWLDAYATDFLSRARAAGFAVPDQPFQAAIGNLVNQVNYATDPAYADPGENAALAYASVVLARERAARIGDLRYDADAAAESFATPMAAAQIGEALATLGDQPRADRMFAQARDLLAQSTDDQQVFRRDYGSLLRDRAAVLAAATQAGSTVIDTGAETRALASQIAARTVEGAGLSTQESVWTVLAAQALGQGSPSLSVDGQALGGVVATLDPLARNVTNDGAVATEVTLTALGPPLDPPAAGGNGYAVSRAYYDLEGQSVDVSAVPLGTRLAVVITVTPFSATDAAGGRLMVTDPLPAGFEIDNPHLLRAGDVAGLDWLDALAEPEMSQFLSDRFSAAVTWTLPDPFRLAYLVRAVTPGVFRHPAASVEDMYRPAYRGWSDGGEVRVTP